MIDDDNDDNDDDVCHVVNISETKHGTSIKRQNVVRHVLYFVT